MGMSGVLLADDLPLSKVNTPRPASIVMGDGANAGASGSPALGDARMCCFPFLTPEAGTFSTWSRQYLKSSSSINMWRSVFPVFGLRGIKLHFCFLSLQR
jgi:hypothetical protein